MKASGRSNIPDLGTQLESLFDQVWRSEADWQLWDRIDAMVEREALRERRDFSHGLNVDRDRISAEARRRRVA